jgi:hypothetical protein
LEGIWREELAEGIILAATHFVGAQDIITIIIKRCISISITIIIPV